MHKPSSNSLFSRRFQVILFSLSVTALVYWCISLTIDVYQYPALGAIFEIAWLPMLAALAIVPVAALITFFKEKKRWFFSLSFYSFVCIVCVIILIMIARNSMLVKHRILLFSF